METKKKYLKYVAIALVIVFVVSAALMLLELWERKQDKLASEQEIALTYKGVDYVRRDDVETFLVIGLDKYAGATSSASHDSGVQSDFLMLFVFDNKTKECSAIHINRDTMTAVNKLSVGGTTVVDTYTKQIALAYNYVEDDNDKIRCGNTKDSVEALLHNVNVDHYLAVTMDTVAVTNDLVGGVEVEILDDFTGIEDHFKKGETMTLTGEQALTYIRTRYGLEDNTNSHRMERQRQYLNALKDKVLTCVDEDEDFMLSLINAVGKYVVYDSTNQKMQQLAEKFSEYEFVGIREIEGESHVGEEFMEFYPDEDALLQMVVDLFCEEAGKKK